MQRTYFYKKKELYKKTNRYIITSLTLDRRKIMGTRGAVGFRVNKEDKVTYNHY